MESGAFLARAGRFIRSQGRSFVLALGFLSRLAPPLRADAADMRAAVFHYPSAGAVLGGVLVLPLWLGCFSWHPLAQAWLYVCLSAWLTRALHLDGLADVLDALGSGGRGEAFRAVLKDSRLGAFGAVGIALYLAGQIALASACLEERALAPLLYAPLLGRCLPALFALLAPQNPEAGLGALPAAPSRPTLAFAVLCALAGGFFCLPPLRLLLCLACAGLCLCFLARLARREGGYSGDFFGCAILGGELSVLFAATL